MSRPNSQHRLSATSGSPSLPVRATPSGRSHSHTSSLGSVSATHRIGRRKSSNFTSVAKPVPADGSVAANRRASASRSALASLNDGLTFMPSSLPQHVSASEMVTPNSTSAVVDGPPLSSFPGVDKAKLKMRRASDGTHLSKKEKAAAGDLKCEQCGKTYKHGSCLNKHLWEHTPQWQYTSKLLISKHQQVQLLEAATVLVTMNQDGTPASNESDSSSPAASGSSDMRDEELSSTETTPPPMSDAAYRDPKRYSNTSSTYSRSYQSVFSSGSMPNSEHGFGHYRHGSSSSNTRPLTANAALSDRYQDEDPQDLAAAVGLLSCSYGTPKTGPTAMATDVPPVPPLPAKYQTKPFATTSNDIAMDDDDDSSEDDAPIRSDEVEESVFGKMDA